MSKKSYIVLAAAFVAVLFVATIVLADDADITAPSDVTNLAASNITQSTALLSWTAPGDDGAVGTSTSYDLRYASSTITDGNWALATQVLGEPTPKPAGGSESMTVSGLASSTAYFFALKSKDEANNESGLSNVVSFTTLAPAPTPTTTPSADVTFEMKVTPRTLNLSSMGKWITVQLSIASPYTARDIDISSIRLNGSLLPDSNFKGTDKFEKGKQDNGKNNSSLLLKFSRSGVQALAPQTSASSTSSLTLTLTGKVSGKTFAASDVMKIIKKVDLDNDGKEDSDENATTTIIQSTSSPDVFVIINGKKRHIPSVQAFERLKLAWANIIKVSQDIINSFADDELLRASNSPDVFIISGGMKRHIPSADVFASYGLNWSDVSVVSPADLADYQNVTLIRAAGDAKVYLLSGGQKHWVTTLAAFNRRGLSWSAVVIVNSAEKDAVPTGTNAN